MKKQVKTSLLVLIMAFAMLTTIQIRMVGAVTATTSMTFTSQTYDGYVYRDAGDTYETVRTADYATATVSESTTCRVGQKYIGEVYRIDRDFLYFDTSMIPSDAAITSAFLRLYVQTDSSATDFNVTIQHSMSHPDTPFTTYDYNYLYYSGNGGSKNTSGITILVYWNITLNDEGISWIDVDGTTKLCLRSNNDIDGTAPTGSEYIVFWSAEKGEAYAPTLYVTYIFNGSQLTIESLPTNTAFTLNGTSESTPYSGALENGTYLINFSSSFVRSGLTWSFSYWNDNTSNTNPIRTINLQSNSSYSVTYTSAYAQSTFTGFGPVFECAMNNMFELDSISESMIGNVQRQMLLDSSAYGNHGHMYPITSPYGGPTLTWGAMGKGLRLDGTDDTVIVPSSLSLNISEALTVEFWMSVDNGTTNQIMISKPNEWHIAILNNSLYAGVYTTGGNYWIESNTTLPDGAFLYVALAYDYRYANASLYINSWLDSSVATDGNPIGLQNSDLYLGSFNNASSYFKGVLDEVRIFPYMKPSGGIYSDAGTGIVKFDSMNFVASSRQEYVGMPVIATEGVIPTYTGLTTNDWQLPWAYANDTYWTTAIRAASYMAGFQSYQLYCNAKFTFSGTMCRSYIHWYWLFFRDGRLQVAYMLELCPIYAVGSAISKWHVRFVRATSYYTNVTMLDYEFYTNYTLYPNSIPIIVSAWIGPDNTHFTIRLDVQDSRMITAYDGSYVTPFVYSFELVDENVNPHLAAWFDGWAVSGIKIETNSYVASWARMEIESHKWFWDPIVIVAQKVVNWVWSAFSTPRNLMVPPDPSVPSQPPSIVQVITTEIVNALMPIAEIIATAVKSIGEPIVNALAGLSHDIIGAVFGLGTVFMQALAPVGQLLLDIGGGFVSALLDGMGVIAKFFTDALYDAGIALASALNDVFGLLGWSGGYTTLSGWVGSGWSWMVSSMTYSISLFPAFFTFLGGWLTGFMEIVVSAFSWWAMEISMIGNFLTGSYGVGVNFWTEYNLTQWIGLVLICYPIFLVFMWDERGLGAVIDHITFMYNSFHLLAYILLTMIHYISSMITRLIELIPVAE